MLPPMRAQNARLLCPYYHNLALAAQAQGRLAEAESLQEEALAHHRDPLQAARAREVLASILTTAGKLDEAMEYSQDAVRDMQRLLGDTHPDTIRMIGSHSMLLARRGDHAAALESRRRQLDFATRAEPRDDEDVANIHAEIGTLRLIREETADAAESFARAFGARPGDWAQDRWRYWILQSGLGAANRWVGPALRAQVMSALLDALRQQPTRTYATDELRWEEMRFSLRKWDGPGTADSGASRPVSEGGLAELRRLKEPEPGLYLISLHVPRNSGAPVDEVLWLQFSPWNLRLYATEGAPYEDATAWQELKKSDAAGSDGPTVAALALANEWYKGFGPGGRTEHFALVATTEIEVPRGQYLLSVSRDDGARVFIDDRLCSDGWEPRGHSANEATDAVVAELSAGRHAVRVEYRQGVDRSRLWLRVEPLDESATKLLQSTAGGNGRLLLRASLRHARAIENARDLSRAEAAYARAADVADRVGADTFERQRVRRGLARMLSGQGKREAAIRAFRDALALCVQMPQGEHEELLSATRDLAAELMLAGGAANLAEAVVLHRGVVEANSRSPQVTEAWLTSLTGLGEAYLKAGDADEAQSIRDRLLDIARRTPGGPPPESVNVTHRIAQLLERLEDWKAVEDAYDIAFDAVVVAEGETFNSTHRLHGLANAQRRQGKLRQAEQTYRQAFAIRAKTMGAKHPEVSWTLGELAGVLQARGDVNGAVDLRREAVEICRTAWGDHHLTTNDAMLRLAQTLARAGRSDEAESIYTQTLATLTRYKGPTHPATASVREGFEQWLKEAGRPTSPVVDPLFAAADRRFSGSPSREEVPRGATPTP